MAVRSLFRTISPEAGKISPGITFGSSANRIVNAYKLGTVGERSFDLHLVDHFGDAFHDLVPRQDLAASRHELCNGLPVPPALKKEIGNKGHTPGVVELNPPCGPCPSALRRECDHKLIFVTR